MINVYKSLIKPLRDLDKTKFLERYCAGLQQSGQITEDKIYTLFDQIDIDTIRADLLTYKLGNVGFTESYKYIYENLDEVQLRKLLGLAAILWKWKGSTRGLFESIRFLAGKEPIYDNWFDFRWILGETEIGEEQLGHDSWLIGGDFTTYDEYLSNLRLMNDGSLDKFLLLAVVDLERVINERIEVVVMDFLDTFKYGRDRWTNINPPISELVDGEMRLGPGTIEEPIISVVPASSLSNVSLVTKFRIEDKSDWLDVFFYYQDGTHHFRLQIIPYQDPANFGVYALYNGGALVTGANLPFPLYAGVNYKLRLIVENQPVNNVYVKAYLDSEEVISWTENTPTSLSGSVRYEAPGTNSDYVFIDNVEFWRNPLKWARMKINGEVDLSSDFYDL